MRPRQRPAPHGAGVRRALRCAALPSIVVLVAACGGGGGARVFNVETPDRAAAQQITGGPGDLVLVGADAAETAAAAAQLRMPGSIGGQTLRPAAPGAGGSRLVLGLGGASADCSGAGGPGTGQPSARAVWCLGDRVAARGQGSGAAFASSTAPGFAGATQRLINEMLSRRRPNTPGAGSGI